MQPSKNFGFRLVTSAIAVASVISLIRELYDSPFTQVANGILVSALNLYETVRANIFAIFGGAASAIINFVAERISFIPIAPWISLGPISQNVITIASMAIAGALAGVKYQSWYAAKRREVYAAAKSANSDDEEYQAFVDEFFEFTSHSKTVLGLFTEFLERTFLAWSVFMVRTMQYVGMASVFFVLTVLEASLFR